MVAKTVILCLFVCVSFCGVLGQVGSICRPNERLLSCGCPKSCSDPVPDCKGVCKEGCFCEDGEVRNHEGICVKLSECPPMLLPYKLDTTEPRFQSFCSKDEEYRFCETCNRTCDNPNPVCPAQCSKGCFCKGDLLRDKDGSCVKFEKCSNFNEYIRKRDEEHNFFEPMPYRYSCGSNQHYKVCQKCTQTCSDPEPVCGDCKTGCFCKDGFVKGPDGKCVKREKCPKAAVTFSEVHLSSIEDCSSGEEYFSCGWCEPTCLHPDPSCPDGCTRGCLCRPPLLRHASGQCVSREQCAPRECSATEEYSCRYGCERRCFSDDVCPVRATRCILGCHCKRGLLRDAANRCVTETECITNKSNNTVIVVL